MSQQSRTSTYDPNQSVSNVAARENRARDDARYEDVQRRASMEMLAQQAQAARAQDLAREDRLIDEDRRIASQERNDDQGFNRRILSLMTAGDDPTGPGPAAGGPPPREPGITLPPRIGDETPSAASAPVRVDGGGLVSNEGGAAPAVASASRLADDSAFARAKDRIGLSMRGAVDSLRDEFAGTGAVGAQAKALGGVVQGGQAQLGDVARDLAMSEEARRREVEDRDYAGALTTRAQDIGQRGQDIGLIGTGYGGGITQRGQDIGAASDRRQSMLALSGLLRTPASARRY